MKDMAANIDSNKTKDLFNYVIPGKLKGSILNKEGELWDYHSNLGLDHDQHKYHLVLDEDPVVINDFRKPFQEKILFLQEPVALFIRGVLKADSNALIEETIWWIRHFMNIKPSEIEPYLNDSEYGVSDDELDCRSESFIFRHKRNEVLNLLKDPHFVISLKPGSGDQPEKHETTVYQLNIQNNIDFETNLKVDHHKNSHLHFNNNQKHHSSNSYLNNYHQHYYNPDNTAKVEQDDKIIYQFQNEEQWDERTKKFMDRWFLQFDEENLLRFKGFLNGCLPKKNEPILFKNHKNRFMYFFLAAKEKSLLNITFPLKGEPINLLLSEHFCVSGDFKMRGGEERTIIPRYVNTARRELGSIKYSHDNRQYMDEGYKTFKKHNKAIFDYWLDQH